jgi:hypothetical protein
MMHDALNYATDDWTHWEDDWRGHWNTTYGTTGRTWDDYAPHYRYGGEMARSDRYRGRTWDEFEPEVRRDWEGRFQEGWEDFKDAVRHAWDSVTGKTHHRHAA